MRTALADLLLWLSEIIRPAAGPKPPPPKAPPAPPAPDAGPPPTGPR